MTKQSQLRNGEASRYPIRILALALLVGGCAHDGIVEGCIEQSDLALTEIADGTLDRCSPGVAAWEREEARACGFVIEEDFWED